MLNLKAYPAILPSDSDSDSGDESASQNQSNGKFHWLIRVTHPGCIHLMDSSMEQSITLSNRAKSLSLLYLATHNAQ